MADRCVLYYITDRSQFRGDERARRHALLAKVAEAARARVDYIQLREKDLSARELEMLARDALGAVRNSTPLRTENRELRTRLLINSRTDIALAAGADGVHLRADDVAPHEVRQVLEVSAHRPLTTGHFLVAVSCRAGGLGVEDPVSRSRRGHDADRRIVPGSWSGRHRRHPLVPGE